MRRDRLHFAAGELFLIVAPGHRCVAVAHDGHRDAVVHGADQRAKIATNAVFFADLRHGFARNTARTEADAELVGLLEIDALMCAVLTRDIAKIAANAFVVIDARDSLPVKIEVLAPNQRPIQVTDDLTVFWREMYPKVKAELSRRYPRHEWR